LVTNDHTREVIETAQSNLPSIISRAARGGKLAADYVTKEEFNEFKQTITERLKSFIGELG